MRAALCELHSLFVRMRGSVVTKANATGPSGPIDDWGMLAFAR